MPQGALSTVLWGTDLDAFVIFLTSVGGATVRTRHPGFAALALAGAEIQVHADESHPTHPWRQALAKDGAARGIGAEIRIRVDAVDERHQLALDMGYVSIQKPYGGDEGRTCQVLGPDGYLFTLWEPEIGSSLGQG